MIEKRLNKLDYLYSPSNQEVYTPLKLVNEVLDKLPSEVWLDKELKWFNPGIKNGVWLGTIATKLIKSYISHGIFNTEQDAIDQVLKNQIYGFTTSKGALRTANKVLYGSNKHKGNVEFKNILEDSLEMKFDIIVGNPPYQKPDGNIGQPLWPKISNKCMEDIVKDDGIVSLVTPATWTNGNSIFKSIIKKYNPICLNINECKKHFPGAGNNTTFSYWVVRKNKENSTTSIITKKYDGSDDIVIIDSFNINNLTKFPTGWIEYSNEVLSIDEKVRNLPKIDFISGPTTSFNEERFAPEMSSTNKYKVIYSKARTIWSNQPEFMQNKKKIIFWHTSKYINNCSQDEYITYDAIGRQVWTIDLQDSEIENALSVLTSKLYILLDKMYRQGAYFGGKNNFPKVDFSLKWNDEDLYNYFKLNKKEIDFINNYKPNKY